MHAICASTHGWRIESLGPSRPSYPSCRQEAYAACLLRWHHRCVSLLGRLYELVSSCNPQDVCREALLGKTRNTTRAQDYARVLDRVAWRIGAEKRLVAELGHALGLGLEKARIAFDVLRCARCRTIAPSSKRSCDSAFYQMIRRTHKRLHATSAPPSGFMGPLALPHNNALPIALDVAKRQCEK